MHQCTCRSNLYIFQIMSLFRYGISRKPKTDASSPMTTPGSGSPAGAPPMDVPTETATTTHVVPPAAAVAPGSSDPPAAGLPPTGPIGQPQVALPVPAVSSATGDSNTSDTPVATGPVVSQPTPQTDGTPWAHASVSQPPGVKLMGQPQIGQMPSSKMDPAPGPP